MIATVIGVIAALCAGNIVFFVLWRRAMHQLAVAEELVPDIHAMYQGILRGNLGRCLQCGNVLDPGRSHWFCNDTCQNGWNRAVGHRTDLGE